MRVGSLEGNEEVVDSATVSNSGNSDFSSEVGGSGGSEGGRRGGRSNEEVGDEGFQESSIDTGTDDGEVGRSGEGRVSESSCGFEVNSGVRGGEEGVS